MPDSDRLCFVIMPFAPEFYYFYVFLKQHIEREYNILCERADAQVMTEPFPDKINDYIRRAEVVIADCSGRNPNVFYEIGIARALGRKIVLITRDEIRETPSDIRHYEIIKYDLDDHVRFCDRLNNCLRNVFVEKYESLYQRARVVYGQFRQATHASVQSASKDVFLSRVMAAERTQGLPAPGRPIDCRKVRVAQDSCRRY